MSPSCGDIDGFSFFLFLPSLLLLLTDPYFIGGTAAVQVIELHRDTVSRQNSNQVVQLSDSRAARHVGRHGQKGLAPQDILHKGGEIPPRPDFHEDAESIGVHRFDGLSKFDRLHPVLDGELADLRRVRWVWGHCRTRICEDLRRRDGPAVEILAQAFGIGLEQRSVIGAVEGENLVDEPLAADFLDGLPHRLLASDDDRLVRAVVHGDEDVPGDLIDDGGHFVEAGAHGDEHRFGYPVFGGDPLIALVELQGPLAVERLVGQIHDARGAHGRIFSGTVAHKGVGPQLEPSEELVEGVVGREDRLDGSVHLPEPFFRLRRLLLVPAGAGKDEIARQEFPGVAEEHAVDPVEAGPHLGKVYGQVREHVAVLGPFAGE